MMMIPPFVVPSHHFCRASFVPRPCFGQHNRPRHPFRLRPNRLLVRAAVRSRHSHWCGRQHPPRARTMKTAMMIPHRPSRPPTSTHRPHRPPRRARTNCERGRRDALPVEGCSSHPRKPGERRVCDHGTLHRQPGCCDLRRSAGGAVVGGRRRPDQGLGRDLP